MEMALSELFGYEGSWYGSESGFQNPGAVGYAIRKATKRLRVRLKSILTVDHRLRLTTSSDLGAIDRVSRDLGIRPGAEVKMMGYLLHLIARLLGFDWLKGVPNREVAYFQTRAQQRIDDRLRHP